MELCGFQILKKIVFTRAKDIETIRFIRFIDGPGNKFLFN